MLIQSCMTKEEWKNERTMIKALMHKKIHHLTEKVPFFCYLQRRYFGFEKRIKQEKSTIETCTGKIIQNEKELFFIFVSSFHDFKTQTIRMRLLFTYQSRKRIFINLCCISTMYCKAACRCCWERNSLVIYVGIHKRIKLKAQTALQLWRKQIHKNRIILLILFLVLV